MVLGVPILKHFRVFLGVPILKHFTVNYDCVTIYKHYYYYYFLLILSLIAKSELIVSFFLL